MIEIRTIKYSDGATHKIYRIGTGDWVDVTELTLSTREIEVENTCEHCDEAILLQKMSRTWIHKKSKRLNCDVNATPRSSESLARSVWDEGFFAGRNYGVYSVSKGPGRIESPKNPYLVEDLAATEDTDGVSR